jgi:hypothetical protein
MGLLDTNYQDQRLTASQKKKIKPAIQGGGYNYLGEQEEVTVPKKWLSDPNHVVAELAYITPREKKVLIDLNMYGSLDGKPNNAPGGLPSLQGDMGSVGGGGSSGGGGGGGGGGGKDMSTVPASKKPSAPSGGGNTARENAIAQAAARARQEADEKAARARASAVAQEAANREAARQTAARQAADFREQYAVARTTTPIGIPVNVPAISPVERDTGLERIRQENIGLADALTDRPFETFKTPFGLANILGNLIGNFTYPVNKDFFQENVAGKKGYGYGYEDFSQYMKDRSLNKVDAYGNSISQEREGSGGDAITNIVSQAPYLISDTVPQPSMVNQYFSTLGMGGQTYPSSVPQIGQPLSSSLQTSYNNAKTTINNLLGITPPSQQFGYSAQPYGLLSSTNITSNPFNIDYLKRLGLI